MEYKNTVRGRFIARPNRFIAHVEVSGKQFVCHVKNTGRCRELLVPGASVVICAAENPARKTAWDLIAVEKAGRLINIDSQAPNVAAAAFLPSLFPDAEIHPEYKVGTSRLDFFIKTGGGCVYLEVKGVTLEENDVVLFPDAPTQRGTKHLRTLTRLVQEGYRACVLFVVQMEGAAYFTPNRRTDPDFADALAEAADAGVEFLAMDCYVTENSMKINRSVEIRL
ncbi:MAG: DNA/RNA nuclease SfsA [Clostridiales bacterium]|nr:DNA/RNA nuclease SfsA [Clostridiales bacterium]